MVGSPFLSFIFMGMGAPQLWALSHSGSREKRNLQSEISSFRVLNPGAVIVIILFLLPTILKEPSS